MSSWSLTLSAHDGVCYHIHISVNQRDFFLRLLVRLTIKLNASQICPSKNTFRLASSCSDMYSNICSNFSSICFWYSNCFSSTLLMRSKSRALLAIKRRISTKVFMIYKSYFLYQIVLPQHAILEYPFKFQTHNLKFQYGSSSLSCHANLSFQVLCTIYFKVTACNLKRFFSTNPLYHAAVVLPHKSTKKTPKSIV